MSPSPKIIELAQPYGPGVLHMPVHPPFSYELAIPHERDSEGRAMGTSGAVDRICAGLHVGTHIDSLSHVGSDGLLCDGTELFAPGVQETQNGVKMRSGRSLRPIVAPGALLDLASHLDCEVLEDNHTITAEELLACAEASEVTIEPGMVILIRTGFDLLWDRDPERFLEPEFPGPGVEAARLLRDRKVIATGSDTPTYEQFPVDGSMPVHVELIVRGGIFIIECLRLYELAQQNISRFQFVALPLNLESATGSPISPVAIVYEGDDSPNASGKAP